jgi:mannose-6-phosphate isomerase-like protein (cupin superfamily)
MRVVHESEIEYEKPRTGHREGDIRFKHLLRGRADSPQNYELMLAHSGAGFPSPPHHHNFDQIRYCLKGKFGDGKLVDLSAGQCGYYPEGAWYSIDSQESEVVLLQFGGANGDGFTHFPQLFQAYSEVSKLGEFRGGRFYRNPTTNKEPDAKMAQDGYEALWQHIYGRPVVYPTPRYANPIVMDPDGFGWRADHGAQGVSHKILGVFTERAIAVSLVTVEAGTTWDVPSPSAPRLLYALQGRANDGGVVWRPGTTAEVLPGECLRLQAEEQLLLFSVILPTFDENELAQRRVVAA